MAKKSGYKRRVGDRPTREARRKKLRRRGGVMKVVGGREAYGRIKRAKAWPKTRKGSA